MKRSLVVASLVAVLALALPLSPAVAVPGPGCAPAPLPSGPGSNLSFSMDVQDVADSMSVTLWRQPCRDSGESVLLMRAKPTSSAPSLCGTRWYLEQDASKFYATLSSAINSADGTGPAFCDRIAAPTTVIVNPGELAGGEPATFDDEDDFTLLFYGSFGGPYVVFTLNVPYAGTSSPTITVVSTRCNPCRSGQTVALDGQVDNPGPAMQAEIKAGTRLPDGRTLSLVNKVVTLASGASVLTLLPPQPLPAGLPWIEVLVEAAILEPVLGKTLSRHNLPLHLLP